MTKRFYLIMIFQFLTLNISFAQISAGDISSDMNSLLDFKRISVTIGGEFIVNGSFTSSTTERVDEFISRIYNQYRMAMLAATKDRRSLIEFRQEIDEYALRGIIIKNRDGVEQKIDLQKFRLTADFNNNPFLSNDDVIIFPPMDWERNFIEVDGAVNRPIQFQFVEGDRLSDALLFARGINDAYENNFEIEVTRLNYEGTLSEVFSVTIDENPLLKRADRIRVVANETLKRDFKVLVEGEVNKPGYIYITKDQTTIKEVIEKAGGFKETADLTNSELIRNYTVRANLTLPTSNRRRAFTIDGLDQEIDLLMMNRMADIETEDSLSLIFDNQLRNAKSIVTVDFKEVLNDSSDNSKFIVKDDDIIVIPEISNLVYVFGQVMNPGYIEYIPERKSNYYISMAGGTGNRAKDEIYLIKGKTRAWIDMTDDDNVYEIESGDYIWVPKDIPRNFDYYLNRTSLITGIIGGVATVVLLFTQLGK
ncbi:MAG: SLBB domain-containing protein [Melioribacteraceae bacterium]|nr:SLBB domain-containing protein [Melioribacteraceae bacterium]